VPAPSGDPATTSTGQQDATPERLRERLDGDGLTEVLLAVFDAQEGAVLVLDELARYVEGNAAFEQLSGRPFEEIRGRTAGEVGLRFAREDGSPLAPADLPGATALRSGRAVAPRIVGVTRPDGATRWYRLAARPLQTPCGTFAVVTFTDVTDVRSADRRLNTALSTIGEIGELIGAMAFTSELAADGTRGAVEYHGVAPERLLAIDALPSDNDIWSLWDGRVHVDDRSRYDAARRQLLRGETAELEYRLVGFDQVVRWVWSRRTPTRRRDGRLVVRGALLDVTARHAEHAELDAARARLATVLEATGEIAYELEIAPTGHVQAAFAGPGLERLIGHRLGADENPSAALRGLVHPDDAELYVDHLARLLRGAPHDVECRLVIPGEGERWVWMRSRPRRAEGGSMRIATLISDVTERRRLQAELTATQGRLAAILDDLADVVSEVEVRPDGSQVLRFVSPGAGRLLGRTLASGADVQRAWADALDPADARVLEAHRARVAAGKPSNCEYRLHGGDGVTRWIWERRRPRRGDDGRLYADGVCTDVSELHALREELRAAHERLDMLVASVPGAVYWTEVLPDGTASSHFDEAQYARLIGTTTAARARTIGAMEWPDLVETADRARYDAFLARVRSGGADEIEYRVRGLDGVTRWLGERASARRMADGGVYVAGITVDLTERRAREEEAARDRNRLAASIESHGLVVIEDEVAGGRIVRTWYGPGVEALLGGAVPAGTDVAALWSSRVHPDDRALHADHRERVRAGEATEAEYRLVGLDGRIRWVWSRRRPYTGLAGELVVSGLVMDVTESRRMRDALDETQRLLAETVEATGDVVLVAEPLADGTFRQRYVSSHAARLLYGADLPAGTDLIAFYDTRVHPEDAVAVAESWQAARDGGAWDLGYRLIGLDGKVRRFWSRGKILETPSGERLLFDVATEITARDALEARAAEAERRFETLVEQVADVFFVDAISTAGERTPLYRSPNWHRVVWGADGAVDQAERRAALDDDDRRLWDDLEARLRAHESVAGNLALRGLDGVARRIWIRARPVPQADGSAIVYGTATDLTEIERVRSEVEASRARFAVVGEALRVHPLTTALEPDGRIVPIGDMRAAVEAVLGPLEPGVEPLDAWVDAIVAEDRDVIDDFATSLRTGRPVDQVYRVRTSGGEIRTVRSLAKGRRRADGVIVADGVVVELD
jgi:PAS domain-containing protein